MPRDISGNYTLPAGNPVVNGTVIDITWGNGTLNDIATQLNAVVTRDGVLGPTAAIKFFAGTAAAPGISFALDTTVGFYRAASQTLGFASGGFSRGTLNGTGNWVLATASAGVTLTLTGGLAVDTLTASGTAAITGTTTLGVLNASGVPTFSAASANWSGNPTFSGNITFGGSAFGSPPTAPGQFATKSYVDSAVVLPYDQSSTAMAVMNYLGL